MSRSVSIVLPTHNGMPRLARVLDALATQRCDLPHDLFCIDTASTDGTWEELERRGLRRDRIEKSEFGHGRTRNRAIAATDGEFVACIVQDAVPVDEHWLQRLVDATRQADDVAGAYSRQVPQPGLNPFLARRLEQWSAGRGEPRLQRLPPGGRLADLPPLEQLALCAFDDVSSLLRRAVWKRHPLPERRFGEDVAWGRAVIEAGLAIAYEPRSVVEHSHDDGPLAEFKRIYLDHANLHEMFGVTTVPTLRDAWRNSRAQCGVYRAMVGRLDVAPERRAALLRFARRLAYAETFGQWLGARSVRKGTPHVFGLVERFVSGK